MVSPKSCVYNVRGGWRMWSATSTACSVSIRRLNQFSHTPRRPSSSEKRMASVALSWS